MRLPLLCSNQYHPIGGLTTIQSCRWSSFQDTDTLYILRIQIGNAISSVTVAGIGRSAYGRPVKDGNAAIREIIDFDKDAEIIIVSSVGTQSQLRSAIEAGAKDFIQKPLNPEQLHSILTSRFEGR